MGARRAGKTSGLLHNEAAGRLPGRETRADR